MNRQISQEVCPHNRPKFGQITREEAFWPRKGVQGERLVELMGMSQEEFSRRFRKSPVKRAKRRGLLRNVAVALGNWGAPEAIPVLIQALEALRGRAEPEEDDWVREELELALATDRGAVDPTDH